MLEALRSLAPGHVISREPSGDVEMLIEGRADRELLARCPRLKWVVVPFAGVPKATIEVVSGFPQVTLHNLHHNAPQTAETAVALLMAAAKQTVPMDQSLRRNDWSPRYTPERSLLLEGRTCLVLGYGEVGSRVGKIMEASGMRILALRRNPGTGEYGMEDLRSLLPQAHVVVIALPLTKETEGLLGRAELDLLPDKAILVNVARAQIVNEQPLFDALKSGKLHSAGLDVWYRYPQEPNGAVPGYFVIPPSATDTPPSAFPFHEIPSVVMSPHRGGAAEGTELDRVRHLARLIEAAASGLEVPNRVSLELGY